MSSQTAAAAVRIAVVGSINVDLVVRVDRRPAPGETVTGLGFDVFPGGKGANQAVAAARLGGSVRMVGRVGADTFAAVALEQLAASGVATDGVVADGAHGTGIASIVVDAAGENSIVVVPGANGAWAEADVARAAAVASWAQVVSLQLEVPFEVNVRVARAARQAGALVVLNPAPAPAGSLPPGLFADVDVLTPNAREAAVLAGVPDGDAESAARRLQAMGAGSVVVTLGDQGALYLHKGAVGRVPAFPVRVVDTTAAGDAFNGALAVALARGSALPEAVRLGCAAGALAATRHGAQPSLPTAAEVRALLRGD